MSTAYLIDSAIEHLSTCTRYRFTAASRIRFFLGGIKRYQQLWQTELYVPQGYLQETTKKSAGVKFVDPTNRGNMVRLMRGNPSSSNPAQQNPYTIVTKNGQHYDANGNKALSGSVESHIPQGTENLPNNFYEPVPIESPLLIPPL